MSFFTFPVYNTLNIGKRFLELLGNIFADLETILAYGRPDAYIYVSRIRSIIFLHLVDQIRSNPAERTAPAGMRKSDTAFVWINAVESHAIGMSRNQCD